MLAGDDDIDAYGLDTFSPEFLVKLSQAEEAFPSSFGALPPATETSSEDEFDVEDMLLTQEMHDALDEMENSYTASQYAAKSQCSERDSSDDEGLVAEREPETVIGTKRKRAQAGDENDSDFSDDDLNLYTPALPPANASTRSSSPTLLGSGSVSVSRSPSPSIHPLPARTHLTQFFASYPSFPYDPTQSASPQFTQLTQSSSYRFSALEKAAARRAYSKAMCLTFNDLYGEDADSLENWWKLCRAVRIDPAPGSVEGCKAAMDAVHVNILELTERLDAAAQVHRFPSERALAHYTVSQDRRFPLSRAHKSPLLSLLLRRIHDPPSESESQAGPRRIRRPLKRRRQEGYAGDRDDAWE
uniref:Uncharacterized protein n=1 Tax=Mycena chlorophos TaxID=658473 RepID=A0ABQ0LSY8_MYCCL|nr:predicted protein [Mycena chlorophos]